MKKTVFLIVFYLSGSFCLNACSAQNKISRFRVLAIAENGGHHILYSKAARRRLDKLAADSSFSFDYIQNTDSIDDAYLQKYRLFIQLDFPPYAWKNKAVAAFERYIKEGRGGWIGFH
ncbi:MAG: ThuA domain-containing protein, partial [Chitinophagaceae bacterium]